MQAWTLTDNWVRRTMLCFFPRLEERKREREKWTICKLFAILYICHTLLYSITSAKIRISCQGTRLQNIFNTEQLSGNTVKITVEDWRVGVPWLSLVFGQARFPSLAPWNWWRDGEWIQTDKVIKTLLLGKSDSEWAVVHFRWKKHNVHNGLWQASYNRYDWWHSWHRERHVGERNLKSFRAIASVNTLPTDSTRRQLKPVHNKSEHQDSSRWCSDDEPKPLHYITFIWQTWSALPATL